MRLRVTYQTGDVEIVEIQRAWSFAEDAGLLLADLALEINADFTGGKTEPTIVRQEVASVEELDTDAGDDK